MPKSQQHLLNMLMNKVEIRESNFLKDRGNDAFRVAKNGITFHKDNSLESTHLFLNNILTRVVGKAVGISITFKCDKSKHTKEEENMINGCFYIIMSDILDLDNEYLKMILDSETEGIYKLKDINICNPTDKTAVVLVLNDSICVHTKSDMKESSRLTGNKRTQLGLLMANQNIGGQTMRLNLLKKAINDNLLIQDIDENSTPGVNMNLNNQDVINALSTVPSKSAIKGALHEQRVSIYVI